MRRIVAALFFVCALAAGLIWQFGGRDSVPQVAAQTTPMATEQRPSTAEVTRPSPAPAPVQPRTTGPSIAPAQAPASPAPVLQGKLERDRYAEAEVIEQAGGADLTTPGIYRQARLIRVPSEKYPLIVVHDEIEVTPDKQAKLVKQQAMVADHVMFKPKPGVTEAAVLAAIEKLGGTVRRKMPASGIWLIALPQPSLKSVPQALAKLNAQPGITAVAEPDYVVHANLALPGDSAFGQLWGLHNTGQSGGTADADIDAPEAWEVTTGSRSVLVGVVDTGIDHTHPDLAANMWTNPGEIAANGIDDDNNGYVDDVRGWDFVNNDNNPMDDNLHGTHCAGTIGAVGDNGQGVTGVCWQVSLVGLKFLSGNGDGSTSDAVEAIAYGTRIGVDITSNSWGGGGYSSLLKAAIDAANTAGILFIAAAGNESTNSDNETNYPSGYDSPNVIAVAATTRNDVLSYFSNYGATTVDLAAPGSEIYSTAPGGSYAMLSGTSMATPHVAGACALLLSHNPTLPPSAVRSALLSSVDPVPALTGRCVSGGRLNVNRAIQRSSELVVEPFGELLISHPLGSPVPDEGQVLTLTNHSRSRVSWTAAIDQPWAKLTLESGTLETGERATIQAKLVTEEIALLAGGVHTAILTVTDLSTGRTHSRTIRLDLVPPAVAEFTLNTDPGWPRSGQWAFGQPTGQGGTLHGHPDPTAGATGSNVLGINLNGDYSTSIGGPWWLTAGPFDLSQRKSTRLAFQRWLNSDYEPWVSALIEVSTNGTQWTTIWRNGFAFTAESAWKRQELDLSAIADRQPRVWVRWGHKVGRTTEVWACSGWNLDDIQILGQLDRALTLTGVAETTEGEPTLTFTLQVHPVPTETLTIDLSASPEDEVSLPTSVTLAAGQGSVTFPVQALDDEGIDGTQSITITATHEGWPAGRFKMDVHDNESAALTLTLPDVVKEGSINVFGTVSVDAPVDRAVKVALFSDDKTTVNVPSSVIIAAGQQSATFPLMVSDDALINPVQSVTLSARVTHWPEAEATMQFEDDEPRELHLDLPSEMQENLAATFTGTVRVGGVLAAPLTVSLTSADILRLTVTPSVTIPAGASAQTFSLTPGDDNVIDGVQEVAVTANAPGFIEGQSTAIIYDNETPALPFNPSPVDGQERTAPKTVLTWSDMPYTGGAPTSWEIYLGTSPEQAMTRKLGSINRRQWPLGRIQRGTTYYWRVVAKRGRASHAGPVWSFTIPSTGLPVRYAWSAVGAVQTVNQPFAVTVTGYDEFGNVATLDGGPLIITAHGNQFSGGVVVAPEEPVTLVNGRWNGTVRIPTLPNTKIRLQARNLADSGVTGESSAFQVKGSAAAVLTVRADPAFTSESPDKQAAKFWVDAGRVSTLAQTINLRSLDHSELLDGTTTLAARAATTEARLRVVDDDIVDGPQTVVVEVWAPGWVSGYGTVQVRDNEANELTLTLPASVLENAGSAKATLSVQHAPVNDVRISLRSEFAPSLIASIKVPAEVILPAGETSVDVAITILQNTVLDFDRTATLTAEVPGWGTAIGTLTVIDDESRDIALSLQPSLTEGSVPVQGLFYLSAPLMAPLTLTLSATNAAQVTLPATVSLPRGAISGVFSVGAVDDGVMDGSQEVDISLSAPGLTTAVKRFVVDDNDAHHFTVTTLPAELHVGIGAYITVTAYDINNKPLGLVQGPITISAHNDDGPVPCTPEVLQSSSVGSGMTQHSIRVLETGKNVRLQIMGPHGSSESPPFDVVRGPAFGVSPGSLALEVPFQHSTTRLLSLSNTGTHELAWSAVGEGFASISPASGTIPAGSQMEVQVNLSAVGNYLVGSLYHAALVFTTNDGLQRNLSLPVDMTVRAPVKSFRWEGLPASPLVNTPIPVTLTAVDEQGQTVTSYDGFAGLGSTLTTNRQIGSRGAEVTPEPFGLTSRTTRTQMIYQRSEVGTAALLQGMAVEMAVLPGTFYRNFNLVIRLKHTTKTSTSEMGTFESNGWTTVYSGPVTLDTTGWNRLSFSNPFAYNGTDHLMVDMTTTASNYGSYARAYGRSTSLWRTLTYSTSNNYGDPLNWTLSPYGAAILPNLRFEVSNSLSPTRTSRFVNGVWSGDVVLTQLQKSQRLIAIDGSAMSYSPYFTVESRGTATLTALAPLVEGQSAASGVIKLQVPQAIPTDTFFTFTSSDSNVLSVPPILLLPAGQSEVDVPVTLPDDPQLEGPQQVGIIFSGPGFVENRQEFQVLDNESTTLHVELAAEYREGDGDQTLIIRLGRNADAPIQVALSSSSARLETPGSVMIPAGASSAVVAVTLPDNVLLDGDDSATITASCIGLTSGSASCVVKDDEVKVLGISWLQTSVNENAVHFFGNHVFLGGITTEPVSLTIESSDPSRVPHMKLVVPAGENMGTFFIRPIDNLLPDGRKSIALIAKADGFISSPEQTITVIDDDPHHFDISPVASPQIRNVPISFLVVARDVDGNALSSRKPEFFFRQNGEALPFTLVTEASFVDGAYQPRFSVDAFATEARLHVRDALTGAESASNAFVVSYGPARAFEWSLATAVDNQPAALTLTALDSGGNVAEGFNGTAALSSGPPDFATVGSGPTYTLWSPLGAAYPAVRTQILFKKEELGTLQTLAAMTMQVTSRPASVLSSYTIRVKPTTRSSFAPGDQFDATGWTTVYSAPLSVPAVGPLTLSFQQRYLLDKSQDLLVDLGFQNNTGEAYNGSVRAHALTANYSLIASGSGSPDSFTQGVGNNFRPQVIFSSGTPAIAITPTQTGAFVNGVWSGFITLTPATKAVRLQATNGNITGLSPLFDILPATP